MNDNRYTLTAQDFATGKELTRKVIQQMVQLHKGITQGEVTLRDANCFINGMYYCTLGLIPGRLSEQMRQYADSCAKDCGLAPRLV